MDLVRYEYQTTEGQRKCWDGEPDLADEGWEEYKEWERFEYTEERYWRRPLTGDALALSQRMLASRKRIEDVGKAERAVIEAAKAALLPIEAYMRARGVPNTTIAELLVAVEALEREGE